jgi:hypothetical protein
LVWFTIAFGSVVGVGLLLAGLAGARSTTARLALGLGLAALVVLSYPVRRVLVFGQVDTLALLLLVAGLVAFAARRDLATALVVGAAIAIKPFLKAMGRFRRHLGTIEKVLGAFLVLTGILFLTDSMTLISVWILETFPGLASIG